MQPASSSLQCTSRPSPLVAKCQPPAAGIDLFFICVDVTLQQLHSASGNQSTSRHTEWVGFFPVLYIATVVVRLATSKVAVHPIQESRERDARTRFGGFRTTRKQACHSIMTASKPRGTLVLPCLGDDLVKLVKAQCRGRPHGASAFPVLSLISAA